MDRLSFARRLSLPLLAQWLAGSFFGKSILSCFANIRVWQQPAATMDSIIWRWQMALEAAEYRQAIRVTDCCPAVWTPIAKHAAWLYQQANAPVAPGCLPPCNSQLALTWQSLARTLAGPRQRSSGRSCGWLHCV